MIYIFLGDTFRKVYFHYDKFDFDIGKKFHCGKIENFTIFPPIDFYYFTTSTTNYAIE